MMSEYKLDSDGTTKQYLDVIIKSTFSCWAWYELGDSANKGITIMSFYG